MCFIGLRSRSPLLVVAGGVKLLPTAFAALSIVSVKKIYIEGGGGYKAAIGLISRNIAQNVSSFSES
jgi:hypothetical protein